MQVESHHPETAPADAIVEPRSERLRRHGRRTGLLLAFFKRRNWF